MTNDASSSRLSCGIVGAGIAGLAAAVALRRAGHEVEIFEKSSFSNEIGAAISIQPNTTSILHRWGFDFDKAKSTTLVGWRGFRDATAQVAHSIDFGDNKQLFGDDMSSFHRVDLHAQLREMAVAAGAQLRLSSPVVDIETEDGIIRFHDGSSVQKDLVVLANGIHNVWIEKVTGGDVPTTTFGMLYRLLVPMEDLVVDSRSAQLFAKGQSKVTESIVNRTIVFGYPCRSSTLLNVAISRLDAQPDAGVRADDWNLDGSKAEALELVKSHHPAFTAIVEHAERVNRYPFSNRNPISRMHKGRAVLIGDAAHAMAPSLGQGGGMAIEDAAALQALFSDWNIETDHVPHRLEFYNKLRHPRSSVVQIVSNALLRHPMPDFQSDCERYCPTGPAYPANAEHFTLPSRKYLYNYDIYAEAAKMLKFERAGDVPDGLVKYFNDPHT